MRTGIIYDEPAAEYHAADAVGSHKLQDMSPHPLWFYQRHVAKTAKQEAATPALTFGQLFHCLALEGEDKAGQLFKAAPECDRRTANGKATYARFVEECGTATVVDREDYTLAWRMVNAIRENPVARKLFEQGKPEVTFRHQMASFAIQSRVDWFDDSQAGAPLILDVKTIDRIGDFERHFFSYGYYRQFAFYRLVVAKILGIEVFQPQCLYLVVEKGGAMQCGIRVPDAESLNIGTQEVMRDLSRLKQCYDTGIWPGEDPEPKAVSLPNHKLKASL